MHFFYLAGSAIITILLIGLHHFDLLHFAMGDVLFVSALIFLAALYRPRIVFLLFIGLIPLEIINIAPEGFVLAVRPYQLVGAFLALAIVVHSIFKKNQFLMPRWHAGDAALGVMVLYGLLLSLFVEEVAFVFQQAVVVFSFFILYLVTRIFIQKKSDLVSAAISFVISVVFVAFYAIIQNILFLYGVAQQIIMVGRPHATFAEPDWLGIFLVLAGAVIYTILYYYDGERADSSSAQLDKKAKYVAIFSTLFLVYTALIITVARSAWLGAMSVFLIFVCALWWSRGFVTALKGLGAIAITVLTAYLFIAIVGLTNFALYDRAVSTTSGLQTITIACQTDEPLPDVIMHIKELTYYNCTHIPLEDIAEKRAAGLFVTAIQREDPNVVIRKETYTKTWAAINERWLTGYGWGSSGTLLGSDGSGTPLNASNIFLEIWISVGAIGLLAFLFFLGIVLWQNMQTFFTQKDMLHKAHALFGILTLTALIVPNLFNAGLLMGFVWVALGSVAAAQRTM